MEGRFAEASLDQSGGCSRAMTVFLKFEFKRKYEVFVYRETQRVQGNAVNEAKNSWVFGPTGNFPNRCDCTIIVSVKVSSGFSDVSLTAILTVM